MPPDPATNLPEFDLATLRSWRGLHPGMHRSEVLELLKAAGLEDADDPADPEWMLVSEWGMDLQFAEEGDQALIQIALDDPQYHWHGTALLGQPLYVALEALGPAAREAGWRPENAVDVLLADLEPATPGVYHDEALLDRGTLWLPVQRMGLVMDHGRVKTLVWREPIQIPRQTVAPVSEAQLQISRRPDADNYLQFWRGPVKRMTGLQRMLTGAFVLCLIGIAVFSFQTQQHWQAAPHATAKVTSIEQAAKKRLYHVEFTDAEGVRQTGTLEGADFYAAPQTTGEEVEIRYLATEPIQVKGPARAQDAAFIKYLPWAIAAFAAYAVLMPIAGWLAKRKG